MTGRYRWLGHTVGPAGAPSERVSVDDGGGPDALVEVADHGGDLRVALQPVDVRGGRVAEHGEDALRAHRKRELEERLAAGPEWRDQDPGLQHADGPAPPPRRSVPPVRMLQERAGVPRHGLYDCLHTAASVLLTQGVSARVVMETLGHSSFALTMDTYTHVLPTLMRDAADATDRALRPAKSRDLLEAFAGPERLQDACARPRSQAI